MTLQRWKLGSYVVNYNPKEYTNELRTTAGTEMTANGTITNQNQFFDNEISFTLSLYNKPSYFNSTALVNSTQYKSIAENQTGDLIYALKNSGASIDKIRKSDGTLSSNVVLTSNASGSPVCHTYQNSQIGVFYYDPVTSGSALTIFGESGNQISKYTYSDPDIAGINSIAWDGSSTIYGLCKYGKIYSFNTSNGSTSLACQFTDYDSTRSTSAYIAIYNSSNGFYGILQNKTLRFYDTNFNVVYSTDIDYNTVVNGIKSISFGTLSYDCFVLTNTNIVKLFPNTCGVDIQKIKNIVSNGIVSITDEKGSSINAIIKSMPIKRIRNKQDTRYEINFSGIIV